MFEFVTQHEYWAAVAIYWIFSAAVSSMPDPSSNGSPGYLFVYRFLHTLAGNITTAFREAARYRACASPGGKIRGPALVLVLTIPLLLSASACAARYTIHPGALNRTDSAAYDALLIAEAAIDRARMEYKAGQLSVGAKEPLNALIQSYNVARDSWLTYRGAIASSVPPEIYFDRLTRNIADLTNAIRTFHERLRNANPTGRSHRL